MKSIMFVLMVFFAGCATKQMTENEKAWNEQCLPYTGCPLNLETPEQFAVRKKIEAQCLPYAGCAKTVMSEQEFSEWKIKDSEMKSKAITELRENGIKNQAKQEKNDQIAKECQWEVAKAMGSANYAYTAYQAGVNVMADTFREVRLMRQCLEAKGFSS